MSIASRTPVENLKLTEEKLCLLRSAFVDSRKVGQGYTAAKANIRHWSSSWDIVCLHCKAPPMFPFVTDDGDKKEKNRRRLKFRVRMKCQNASASTLTEQHSHISH